MRRRKSWKLEVINSQKWAVVGCAEIFRWGFPPATAARWHTGNLWLRTFGKRPFSWHPIISNYGGMYLILLTNFQNFLSISMLNEHWGDMQEFANLVEMYTQILIIKEKLSSPIEWSLSNGEKSRNLFQKCNCNRHKYKYFRPKRKFEFRDFMAACSGKFQMIHNFPIRKMKNGGSNQVVLKLIKLRKKRKQMRLLNRLCYYKPNKEVIKNRWGNLLLTYKFIDWRKKSKWGFSINYVITSPKRRLSKTK